jgi:F-type H+-transporting ATPase subunit delta
MRAAGRVARRYARALRDLAGERRQLDRVAEELAQFERLLAAEAELRTALLRPWVKAGAKRAIAFAVAERLGLSALTRNFLALVAQRRRLDLLPEIVAAYRALVDEAAGRIRAQVRSAVPLSDPERATLRERLSRKLGKTVFLDTEVDPALLGGFVAEVGSRVLDASLAGQLSALGQRITRAAGGAA